MLLEANCLAQPVHELLPIPYGDSALAQLEMDLVDQRPHLPQLAAVGVESPVDVTDVLGEQSPRWRERWLRVPLRAKRTAAEAHRSEGTDEGADEAEEEVERNPTGGI